MKKLTKPELDKLMRQSKYEQLLYLLERYDNYIPLVSVYGLRYFTVQQIKDISDATDKFINQIKNENKLKYWCEGYVDAPGDSLSLNALPIYGRSDNYETNWFTETRTEAIKQVVRDRHRSTYNDIIKFQTNEE